MQLKFITATIAAFAVGYGLAGPLPIEDNAIEVHTTSFVDIQLQAAQFAADNANSAISVAQWNRIKKVWPWIRFPRRGRSSWAACYFVQNQANFFIVPNWQKHYPWLKNFHFLNKYNTLDWNSWDNCLVDGFDLDGDFC